MTAHDRWLDPDDDEEPEDEPVRDNHDELGDDDPSYYEEGDWGSDEHERIVNQNY